MNGTIKLPTLGKYTRKAIDHPDQGEAYGKQKPIPTPRTTDPDAEEVLIVDVVKLEPAGRDIQGRIKFFDSDDFRPYTTSIIIFNNGGWTLEEAHTQ